MSETRIHDILAALPASTRELARSCLRDPSWQADVLTAAHDMPSKEAMQTPWGKMQAMLIASRVLGKIPSGCMDLADAVIDTVGTADPDVLADAAAPAILTLEEVCTPLVGNITLRGGHQQTAVSLIDQLPEAQRPS